MPRLFNFAVPTANILTDLISEAAAFIQLAVTSYEMADRKHEILAFV